MKYPIECNRPIKSMAVIDSRLYIRVASFGGTVPDLWVAEADQGLIPNITWVPTTRGMTCIIPVRDDVATTDFYIVP